MNIFKKIYCRIFQTAFKLAIPILPYRNPQILNSVEGISNLLCQKRYSSILIVTDKQVSSLPSFALLKESLNSSNIITAVFDETIPNPTVHNVEKARQLYVENSCQAIIGFGGGSPMDCAKAVGARIARPRMSVTQMKGILKIHKKTPFFIAIPTTAGTGSETTVTTIITDSETNRKLAISDFPLIPDVAVLDPEITATLPAHLVASTGIDALVHAIEAYIGRSTVKSTRKDALEATKLIFENLEEAYRNPSNTKARKNMLLASHMAGRAFSKSYVGYCHAVAHTLGGQYHTPHGLANAILIPYVLEAYGKSAHNKLKEMAIVTGIANRNTHTKDAAEAFISEIRNMNRRMNIPEKLKGIRSEDISRLATYAEKEANPLYPVPKLFTARELEKFYYDIMEEEI